MCEVFEMCVEVFDPHTTDVCVEVFISSYYRCVCVCVEVFVSSYYRCVCGGVCLSPHTPDVCGGV